MVRHAASRPFRLAKEGGWIVIGQITAVVGALALVRTLTERLNAEQYGQLALGLTVGGLLNQVVMGGVIAGIGRFYSLAAEQNELAGYLRASRHLLGFATLAALALGLVLIASLSLLGYSQWILLAVAALTYSVLSGYNNAISSVQNAARQRSLVAVHTGLDAWLKIFFALGAMLWLGTSSSAVLIGYICSSLVITASQFLCLKITIPASHKHSPLYQSWQSRMWAYSWPFTTWGGFTWMQQVSDRWALQAFASTSDVGQYAVLFQLGYTPISIATGIGMTLLGPIFYQRSGNTNDQVRNQNVHLLGWRMTHLALIITAIGFVATFVLHDWFFRLLATPEYRKSSYLLPWVVVAGGIFASGQILALKLMSEMKSLEMISLKIITALIGVLLNIGGAYFAGLSGVVASLIAFSCIHFIWIARLGRYSLEKYVEV